MRTVSRWHRPAPVFDHKGGVRKEKTFNEGFFLDPVSIHDEVEDVVLVDELGSLGVQYYNPRDEEADDAA